MGKILHIYKSYYPETTGGVEQVIKNIAAHSDNRQFQHKLFTCCHAKSHTELVDNLPVNYAHTNFELASTPFSWEFFRRFEQEIQNADLLHFQYPWPFAEFCYAISQIKKPTVVSYQSDIVKQKFLKHFYKPFQKVFFNKVDAIVPSTENYLNTSTELSQYRDKCKIIPIGIESLHDAQKPTTEVLNQWRNKLGEDFILFVGVLRYYKGLPFLIEAAKNIQAKIVIAGKGPMLAELKAQVQKLNLTNIEFVGHISQEDKAALLELASIFVFPSHLRAESFGVCLLEAMSFQKPMVTTEIGSGTSFVNLHNDTGLVVKPSSAHALADACNKLLDDPALRLQMGNNALKRFNMLFTAEKMAKSYDELYNSLINS